VKGKHRRTLTRDDWIALANKVRAATAILAQIELDLSSTLTVASMKPFYKAFGRVQSLRTRLDALVVVQHRDWPEASRLFYGPEWTYNAHWG